MNGDFVWNELMTRDSDAAQSFYQKLFGWKFKQSPLHGDYRLITQDGVKDIGGIMKMGKEFPEGIRPHWMPYVSVESVDVSCEKVKELGGKVCVPPTDIPAVGRFAIIEDPTGGTMSIISLLMGHK